jgi:hypothetical protein
VQIRLSEKVAAKMNEINGKVDATVEKATEVGSPPPISEATGKRWQTAEPT